MATSSLSATLTVQFDPGDSGAILKAEIDNREDGLNGGKTSFSPGDDVFYLVYKSEGVSIVRNFATIGTIGTAAGGSREIEEWLVFANDDEQSISYPATGTPTYDWEGAAPEPVNAQPNTLRFLNNKFKLKFKGIGVLHVKYMTAYSAYKLGNTPASVNGRTNYQALIVIVGSPPGV